MNYLAFLWLTLVLSLQPVVLIAQDVDFTRDVRPVLSDKCFACHGNDEETREAGLRLDLREAAIDAGAILPGSLEDSAIWERINSEDEDSVMPPPHTHKPFDETEKEVIRRWIEQGAVYQQHWAYRPVSPPEVKLKHEKESPIDALIRKGLQQQGLSAVAAASRETLIRRLSLDLTGLPPTPNEVDDFLHDKSASAYEHLVDRLLDREAFGERMAVFWLDLVRYADTIGYHSDNFMEVSAYRDYVINSFNANKPFDEFTIEQLAGDLLDNATTNQKIASGYNRLLQTTQEGGAQPKEYIAIYAADRVRNVSGVWLGQTMGCAQCHDHKYDPITQKDFYAMSAFFADIRESAVGKRVKNLYLYTDQEQARQKSLKEELAALQKEASEFRNGSDACLQARAAWEKTLLETGQATAAQRSWQWLIPEVTDVEATAGKLKALGDGSFLITGDVPQSSNYSFTLNARQKVTAIRLEALTDPDFKVENGLSRSNGNFVLTDFSAFLDGEKIRFASARADHQSNTGVASNAIDDIKESGWSVDGHRKRDGRRVIIFRFSEPLDLTKTCKLQIVMKHETSYARHNIGRFRVSIPASEELAAEYGFDGETGIPRQAIKLIRIPVDQRSEDQQRLVVEAFLDQSTEMAAFRNRIAGLKKKIDSIRDNARTMLIADALPKPRMTKIRNRGDWMDESGEEVRPAVPEFLPSNFDAVQRRLNRLDLAKWLVEPANPLTSRTFVNRIWKVFFGRGLSNNLDDLGGQGEPPTHPELLDWLAADFQSDWNIKRAIKQIVMSEAYRRQSIADAETAAKDPGNLWYARQGRWRIDAEFVRDTAMQLSGLLDASQIGGRSVKPYQPAGYWQHLNFPKRTWIADSGSKLYRKSLYTFWCRSFLHPTMLAFDAPTREECVASRALSNIPQQALVLLNDPIFVEASRGFGSRILQVAGDAEFRIGWAWREATGREATPEEVELLAGLYVSQKKRFANSGEDAKALLCVGEAPLPEGIDVVELAAWTQVARAILNTYETISRH